MPGHVLKCSSGSASFPKYNSNSLKWLNKLRMKTIDRISFFATNWMLLRHFEMGSTDNALEHDIQRVYVVFSSPSSIFTCLHTKNLYISIQCSQVSQFLFRNFMTLIIFIVPMHSRIIIKCLKLFILPTAKSMKIS